MTGPNAAVARVARSTIAEGWARLSIMALVPITLGLGGWIGVSIINQGESIARMDERIAEGERDVSANTARIEAMVLRLGNNDSAQARIEAEISGVRQSLSRVEDMLGEILRERRSELSRPR